MDEIKRTIQLPFKEAIQFLKGKGISTEPLEKEENENAFYIGGVTEREYLENVKTALVESLENGTTFAEFSKKISTIVDEYGWSNYRLFTIYQTNINQAYRSGRYNQMKAPAVWNNTVGLQWVHGNSVNPRPHHLALNGKIFPRDSHSFASESYPPCGWGCRCRVFPVLQVDIDNDPSLTIEDPGETFIGTNGKTYRYDELADPEFKYAPSLRQAKLKDLSEE